MIKILAIGNSFSQDATRYLYQIARADKVDMKVVNLYIGGCPLSYHYSNTLSEEKKYDFELNGRSTGIHVSIKDGLLNESWLGWDFVTMQQVSHQSVNYESFQPYLNELSSYIKKYSPKAKQFIHQTWAYEEGSKRLTEELGYNHQLDMFNDVKSAYGKAAKDIDVGVIPCGETLQNIIKEGLPVHRDTFHASLGLGRYALALTWYEMLTGNSTENNSFRDFDVPVTEEEVKIAKKAAHEAVLKYR